MNKTISELAEYIKLQWPNMTTDDLKGVLTKAFEAGEFQFWQKLTDEIRKIKRWVFVAPFGGEFVDGKVVPRERKEEEYLKLGDIMNAISEATKNPTHE